MRYLFLIFLFPIFVFAQVQTQSESTNVNLIVEGCNNNSICEANIGENINNCPLDCSVDIVPPDDEDDVDDTSGRSGSKINIFEIDVVPESVFYPDVNNARVVVENKNVFLSWTNPVLTNFEYVRVMKNNFYSDDPYDGELVYEGYFENLSDEVDFFNRNYFYNIFSRYSDGQFSKGVGFMVSAREPSIVEDVDSQVDDVIFREEDKKDIFFNKKFNIYDLIFVQDSSKLRWKRDVLQAISNNQIHVSLPKKDFFGEIEDIYLYVDLYNFDDEFFRRDILKLDYSAVDQLYKSVIFDITDVKNANFRLSVMSENKEDDFVTGSINFEQKIEQKESKNDFILLFILIPIIFILILFFKRKKSNK
jgi:hypothetical protein